MSPATSVALSFFLPPLERMLLSFASSVMPARVCSPSQIITHHGCFPEKVQLTQCVSVPSNIRVHFESFLYKIMLLIVRYKNNLTYDS